MRAVAWIAQAVADPSAHDTATAAPSHFRVRRRDRRGGGTTAALTNSHTRLIAIRSHRVTRSSSIADSQTLTTSFHSANAERIALRRNDPPLYRTPALGSSRFAHTVRRNRPHRQAIANPHRSGHSERSASLHNRAAKIKRAPISRGLVFVCLLYRLFGQTERESIGSTSSSSRRLSSSPGPSLRPSWLRASLIESP